MTTFEKWLTVIVASFAMLLMIFLIMSVYSYHYKGETERNESLIEMQMMLEEQIALNKEVIMFLEMQTKRKCR